MFFVQNNNKKGVCFALIPIVGISTGKTPAAQHGGRGEEEEEGRKGKLRGKPFFLRPATVRESYFLLFALLLPYLLLLESRSLSSGV
jgi:hypothetical protein